MEQLCLTRLCQAVPCYGGSLAALWPDQWLSLVLHRDVQRCLPVAPQPLAQVCGCPVAGEGFVCISCLEQLEWIP